MGFVPDGERLGGAPANFACHAAIQGADVTMVSAIGDDRNGHDAIGILSGYGIDVSLIQIIPDAPTGTVGIALDTNGKPTFTIHQGSAWDRLAWNDELASRINAADAIYFGTLGQRSDISRATIRQAIEAAAGAGIPRILDINLRPPFFDSEMIRESVQHASILKLSDDELARACSACGVDVTELPEVALRGLLQFGSLDMVVMTRGANGAVLVTLDDTVAQDGISTNVIDTVGAGDAFMASFLIGELQKQPTINNLRHACEFAAATCAHSGAVPPVEKSKHWRTTMKQMRIKFFVGSCLACLSLSASTTALAQTKTPPNIVFILVDDTGWNALDIAADPAIPGSGSSYYQTPNTSKLARSGIRFSMAYSPAPTCGPSRTSIQYGMTPSSLGKFCGSFADQFAAREGCDGSQAEGRLSRISSCTLWENGTSEQEHRSRLATTKAMAKR